MFDRRVGPAATQAPYECGAFGGEAIPGWSPSAPTDVVAVTVAGRVAAAFRRAGTFGVTHHVCAAISGGYTLRVPWPTDVVAVTVAGRVAAAFRRAGTFGVTHHVCAARSVGYTLRVPSARGAVAARRSAPRWSSSEAPTVVE